MVIVRGGAIMSTQPTKICLLKISINTTSKGITKSLHPQNKEKSVEREGRLGIFSGGFRTTHPQNFRPCFSRERKIPYEDKRTNKEKLQFWGYQNFTWNLRYQSDVGLVGQAIDVI